MAAAAWGCQRIVRIKPLYVFVKLVECVLECADVHPPNQKPDSATRQYANSIQCSGINTGMSLFHCRR